MREEPDAATLLATFFHRFPIFAFHAGGRGEQGGRQFVGGGGGEGERDWLGPGLQQLAHHPAGSQEWKPAGKRLWGNVKLLRGEMKTVLRCVCSHMIRVKLRIEDRSELWQAGCRICSESPACSFWKVVESCVFILRSIRLFGWGGVTMIAC